MSYKDTLTLYEELVATGIPDSQAKIMAHQQGAVIDVMTGIGFRLDKSLQEMQTTIAKHDTTLKLMMTFVAFMTAAFVANILFIKFG